MTANKVGLSGLVLTAFAALASPLLAYGGVFTLGGGSVVILGLLAVVGMILSLVGCVRAPRGYGAAGLVIGVVCVLFWAWFVLNIARAMGDRP